MIVMSQLKQSWSQIFYSSMSHPFLVLDDVISYGGQSGPFAVVGGANSTALMSFKLTNCREIDKSF